jgi:outer membrane immunogenic protein
LVIPSLDERLCLEYQFAPLWTLRAEYRYTDLGSYSKTVPLATNCPTGSCSSPTSGATINLHPTNNAVRLGLGIGF